MPHPTGPLEVQVVSPGFGEVLPKGPELSVCSHKAEPFFPISGERKIGQCKGRAVVNAGISNARVRVAELKISFLYANLPLTDARLRPFGPDTVCPKTSLTCYFVFSWDDRKYCICPQ